MSPPRKLVSDDRWGDESDEHSPVKMDEDREKDKIEQETLADQFRKAIQEKMGNDRFMNLPPPEELMKKSVAENEEFRTGAQIAFVKL